MLRFLVLASFAALVLAQLAPEPRYLEDVNTEERTVGDEVANANSWPWQISIQSQSGDSWNHKCGGTLVKTGWVLTAAQCVDSPMTLRVVLGDHDIYNHEGSEQYISVSHVYIHPSWNVNSPFSGYDIALLQLSSNASLNNYVQLGALPPSGQILPNNNLCYLTGWGSRPGTGGQLLAKLKQVYLPYVDYNTCSTSWYGSTVKTSMICAGGSDSGCLSVFIGPLNCNVGGQWVVHGVTSFMFLMGCSNYGKPVVFTRVSNYISWMNDIMG